MIVNKISGWWFGTFLFSHISGIIIPTDFHIFQGVETTNQNSHYSVVKFQPHHQWHQALPVSYWSPVTADDGQTYYYNLETGGVEVFLSLMPLDLGKFHHDLTVLPSPGIMVKKGNDPQMAELFNLVNYYNVPRFDIPSFYMNVTTKNISKYGISLISPIAYFYNVASPVIEPSPMTYQKMGRVYTITWRLSIGCAHLTI